MASSSSSWSLSRRLLCLAVCLSVPVSLVLCVPPSCPRWGPPMQWLEDPDDCSKFYVCHGKRRFSFNCGENIWDQGTKSCVGKGSLWDKCTIPTKGDNLGNANSCDNSNSAIFAKADNCAQYYDCGSQKVTVSEDPHVVECDFPLLFNLDTKRCEHYDMVKCGDRPEPKDACEYENNQCSHSAHCIPCMVRFPSCKGLPDGLNPWKGRKNSAYYVFCQSERAVYQGQCDSSNGVQLFDADKRMCAEMKPDNGTIPTTGDNIGNTNSCDNSNSAIFAKADNCAQYYDCGSQKVTVSEDPHVVECDFPLLFNPDTKRCEHYDMVKCGDRPEPKDVCEYENNQCRRSAHCIPCMVRFPSCKGLPDGLNPWKGRKNSAYYVFCKSERAVYQGQCDSSNGVQLFDADKHMCAEMKPDNGTIPTTGDNIGNANSCDNSNSAIFAKADNCAQYYDCGSQKVTVSEDPHVVECDFPLLFNPDTKRCEHYDMVKCGDRPEPKDACEYENNQCSHSAHCIPCMVRFPSCKGLPDGLNPWKGRKNSAYYVFCKSERAVYQGQCDSSNGVQLFDADKRMCAEMKPDNGTIPTTGDNIGNANSCDNSNSAIFAKADNCAQYYDCGSQKVTVSGDPHVVECDFPLLFNPDTKRCEHYDMVKCGDRPEPKDVCEYENNQCRRSAHCIPCMVRFPSCKGLPDGLNPWKGRKNSPYYVLCKSERAVYQGQCDSSNGVQLFDADKRMCAEMKPDNGSV